MGIFFNKNKKKTEEEKIYEEIVHEISSYNNQINAELFAEFTVINYIAKEFAKSKVMFYENGKRKNSEEYYRWNVKPNEFQTAFEFKHNIATQYLLQGEVLIFEYHNSLIVADTGFSAEHKGTDGYIFQNITKDGATFYNALRSNEVIYLKCEQNGIVSKLNSLLSGLQSVINSASSIYDKQSHERVILEMSSAELGDENRQKKIKAFLDERFKKFFESKGNAVMPIFEGMKYHDLNTDSKSSVKRSEVDDISEVIDEMISKAAIAHGVRPSVLLGDKENTTVAEKATISNAIKPIAEILEEGINGSEIISKEKFINGKYAEVDLTPLTYTTIFDNAEATDMLLRSSQYNVDELRTAVGRQPLNTWWSQMYWRTLNNELIPLDKNEWGKGGDE